ncbi:MauE/DoxX family redox-associated membrane protein, partial [Singulisphaera rosea]
MALPEQAGTDPVERAVARLRGALGLATILMLVLSKTLWVTTDAFPRVPFLKGIPEFPSEASWGVFALLIVTIAAAAVGLAWRASLGVSLAILVVLVLGDQHRLQPWVYQYAVTAVLLATLPNEKALGFVRWWYASLYLHSGLSKLDVSFVYEMGPLFLNTIARLVGFSPAAWPQAWRSAAIVAMPGWEIVVAALLVIPATRKVGV